MDNYPPGAAYDPSAPYNEVNTPYEDFDVELSYNLYRDATINTNEYEGDYRYYGDIQKDYEANYMTPLAIIQEYQKYCKEQVAHLHDLRRNKQITKEQVSQLDHFYSVIASCDGWEEEYQAV